MVRAKFVCDSVIGNVVGGSTVSLHAVYGHEGENASFTKHTPAGNLQLVIEDNTPAVEFFKQGQTYYLDITEAPAQ